MELSERNCYNIPMSKSEKKKILIESVARSMEAEGFSFAAVKKILEQKLTPKK